jgi:hypothetical protein
MEIGENRYTQGRIGEDRLADAYKARAHTPGLEINQMCRLGRIAVDLLRSAAQLDRTLARRQNMPTAFFGVVVQDEVDIPALEAIWASQTPAADGAGSPASASPISPASASTPPPAAPQPATATTPLDPQPDPEPTPPTAPQLQAPPDQSPDPATQPGEPPAGEPPAGEPPAPPRTRPAGAHWMIEHLDQGPGYTREVLRRRTAADPLPEPAE